VAVAFVEFELNKFILLLGPKSLALTLALVLLFLEVFGLGLALNTKSLKQN